MNEKEKEMMDALDLTSEIKEKEVMDALDLTSEIKERKERKKPEIPKGYTVLKVNIKKEKKVKFWKLKKGLGRSFGNLIMKWIDEEYEKLYK